MGYLSMFSMKISGADEEVAKAILDHMRAHGEFGWALDLTEGAWNPHEYPAQTPCKWYDVKEDLGVLSYKFRCVHFVVTQIGKVNGHMEKHYARGGRVESVKVELQWPPPPAWFTSIREMSDD